MVHKRRYLRFLIFFVKLAVSTLALYIVIKKIGSENFYNVFHKTNPIFFFIVSLFYILATFISSIRWKMFIPGDISVMRLFSLYMIGSFFNNLLPGLIGGDALKAYYLYRDTKNTGISMASVFMDRYVGFVALMMIALIALPFGIVYIRNTELRYIIPLLILFFVIGSTLFFRLKLGNRLRFLNDFYGYFDSYVNNKKNVVILFKTFLLSIIIQLVGMVSVYIIARGFEININFISILIFVPLIVTVSLLPVSISGLGIREGAFVILFGNIGVKPELALMISLTWFLSVVMGSLPGAFFYLINKKVDSEDFLR